MRRARRGAEGRALVAAVLRDGPTATSALCSKARKRRTSGRNFAMTQSVDPSEQTVFETIRERLFTAAIGDVMDAMDLTHQFLPPGIRALVPGTMIVGR